MLPRCSKRRAAASTIAARRHRRDNAHTQALGKQLGTLAAGVALAGVAAAPVDVLAAESTVAGPAAGRSEFSRQLAQLRETKPAPAKARSAPAAEPVKTPSKAQQIKVKKAAPTTPVRAADVSFDAPAQAKREGKVIKNTAPKSERDAAAATATEAARVAAREKAAAAAAAKEAKSAAKAAEAAQARADRAAKAAAPVAPAPAKGKASTKAPAAAPAKGKAAPAPAKGKAATAAKAAPAKAAPAPATKAAAAPKKAKSAPPAPLPEEVAREKTSEQIAETREKKKEVRALRGMAGSTKGEVKKYKNQEKALDKKLATLAKSKRQQDAKVARAKGRQAKAKKRAAQVEKVVCPRPIAPS